MPYNTAQALGWQAYDTKVNYLKKSLFLAK